MSRKLFGIDLDDTLMWNVWHYNGAMWEAVRLIVEAQGPRAEYVVHIAQHLNEVDRRRVDEINPETGRQFKYSKDRFPGSLRVGYLEICQIEGVEPNLELADRLLELGQSQELGFSPFDRALYVKSVHEHAEPLLRFLREQGDSIHLVTAGDQEIQNGKIAALKELGLLNLFDSVAVVEFSKSQTLREIADGFSGRKYFIGNSWSSDMEAAFAAEYHGIFIPRFVWTDMPKKDEILAAAQEESMCTVLSDLANIISIYKEL